MPKDFEDSRRSEDVVGMVNFPIGESDWENSHEGGLTVTLHVFDSDEGLEKTGGRGWKVCFGPNHRSSFSNDLITSEDNEKEVDPDSPDLMAEMEAERLKHLRRRQKMFPFFDTLTGNVDIASDEWVRLRNLECESRPCHVSMTLGSTGWSGWSDKRDNYFRATFDDLTEDGKALYRLLERTYQGCEIVLLTWLDT